MKHPYSGCAFNAFIEDSVLSGTESIQNLSKYADAVTVCCYEKLGNITSIETFTKSSDNKLTNYNTTAIGNIAFVGLHHSNNRVRLEFSGAIERWKKLV